VRKAAGPSWTGRVELIESRLEEPLKWKTPRRVFVNSMSDLFHEALVWRVISDVFDVMERCPQHTFQVLTKREERMRIFMAGRALLPNVWLGVSVEDRARKNRIEALRSTRAAVRFLSIEPLIEDIGALDLTDVDWVIVGGESGPGARPFRLKWARSVKEQCKAAGVPFFMKQFGSNSDCACMDTKGGEPAEWPAEFRVREFPEVAHAA
jgi:protein gp37